jgi:hypothetical protein
VLVVRHRSNPVGFASAPFLFGFALHRPCRRILALDPVP